MAKITIEVSPGLLKALTTAGVARGMSGSMHGVLDEFVAGAVKRMNAGDEHWAPEWRGEKRETK